MNIKITRQHFEYLNNLVIEKFIVGSKMYGTSTETSDTDYLCIFKSEFLSDLYYPNYHQLQYDDIENNSQYMFTSEQHFYNNLFSGDATINADVVMFSGMDLSQSKRLNMCRTYNVIKAYIGFAKRDLKMIKQGKSKLFHIDRGLYCAEKLLDNKLPELSDIKNLFLNPSSFEHLKEMEDYLKFRCNSFYEQGIITRYPKDPIIQSINDLEKLLIESNNIKEFKY